MFAPLRQTFTYRWPASWGEPRPGVRVIAPFGRGRRQGLVLGRAEAPPPGECKAVLDVVDEAPLFDAARMRWLARAGRYWLAAPGEWAETATAWAAEAARRWRVRDGASLAAGDELLAAAFGKRQSLSTRALGRKLPVAGFYQQLHRAARAGWIEPETDFPSPEPPAAPRAEEQTPARLTGAQQRCLDALATAEGFAPFLLFGCTGSGKTEVYLREAERRVAAGGQALILIPEIGLTPQWLSRLTRRFARVAVWHSGLSDGERLAVRARLAELDVLIGTRSALFLPLPRLSLIVVDEEHDHSFKQQEGMAYHARDMALLLAQELEIPVIMGSATPSLESWRQAREGRYRLLALPERIAPHPPPAIEVVDMRGREGTLSEPLVTALEETRKAGRQSILYLNRRGYAPALMCGACGEAPECPACAIRLTLHRRRRQLRCHACGFVQPAPAACPSCGEPALLPLGEGTERVMEELAERLPDLRVARLDRDAAASARRLVRILDDFAAGRVDCLVGTQMLVKGHHFPNVTLVGVVNADLGLGLPDFRAGERWWQQITQVIGRTGRGDAPGRILVQTRNPEAEWLQRIGDANAEETLDAELALRRALGFPPWARWARIVCSATRAERAMAAARTLHEGLTAHLPEAVRCMSPMPCAIERLASRWRVEMVLRDATRKHLPWALAPLLARFSPPPGVRVRVDVDPMDMM